MERFVIQIPEKNDYQEIEKFIDDMRKAATFGGSAVSFSAFIFALAKSGKLDIVKNLAIQAFGELAKKIN